MAIDMRHSKLKPEEAALLAGELTKPNWQSKNEGIHERVSFEDTIWGFDLAGGSYYQTPLRVVGVKKGSRAEKAGIRLGDKLKRINDIDTATLTIQEAHEIIVDSGVHLKIAVSAPEDEEDAYFCYEDQLESGYDSEEERRRLLEEKIKKRQIHAKVSSYWSLQWPWVSKRRVIYRESNCFMVPSKYEGNHKDQFPSQPFLRVQDDIVQQKEKNTKHLEEAGISTEVTKNNITNGDGTVTNGTAKPLQNGTVENIAEETRNDKISVNENGVNVDDKKDYNGHLKDTSNLEVSNYENMGYSTSKVKVEATTNVEEEVSQNQIKEQSDIEEGINHDEFMEEIEETVNELKEAPHFEEYVSHDEDTEDIEDKNSTINDETSTMNDEDIISQEEEVIKGLADDGDLSTDDDRLLDSILSDSVDSRRNNDESER